MSPRLGAAASFVRRGSRILDVGTDHCHIPIFLFQNGICSYAAASDVVDGPLEKAEKNLAEHGLGGKVRLRRADGLDGCESDMPDDILICGMGGELIAQIISRSEYVRDTGIRLILQPMTKASALRVFLYGAGFEITGEKLVREDRRIYEIICARFTGSAASISPLEALIGKDNYSQPEFADFIRHRAEYILKRIRGFEASANPSGVEYEELLELYRQLEAIKEKL